jgi:hypothetical protein
MEDFSTPIETRGRPVIVQSLVLNDAYTTPIGTANVLKQLFNTPINGAFNARAATTYFFECRFDLSNMSATSGSFGFGFLGSATITSQKWDSLATKLNVLTTATAPVATVNNTATNNLLTGANTLRLGWARVWGVVRINAAGTLIPSFSLGVAAAAVVGRNSFFKIYQVGSNTMTNTGFWT